MRTKTRKIYDRSTMSYLETKGVLREGALPEEPTANYGCGRCGAEIPVGDPLVYAFGKGVAFLCRNCWEETDPVQRWFYASRVIHWWMWEAAIRTDLGERFARECMEAANDIFNVIMNTDQGLGWSAWKDRQ